MKTIFKLFTLLFFVLFNSCNTIPPNLVSTNLRAENKEGMIVGTISLEDRKSWVSQLYFFYSNVDSSLVNSGNIKNNKQNKYKSDDVVKLDGTFKFVGNFEENGKLIFLFSIIRPEGKYSFNQLDLFKNSGYRQSMDGIKINYPFEIEKGKTKYIGELNVKLRAEEVRLLNSIDKDRLRFRALFPSINF